MYHHGRLRDLSALLACAYLPLAGLLPQHDYTTELQFAGGVTLTVTLLVCESVVGDEALFGTAGGQRLEVLVQRATGLRGFGPGGSGAPDEQLWAGGECPTIEIECNVASGFIYSVLLQINTQRSKLRERGLLDIFLMDLHRSDVLDEKYGGVSDILKTRRENALAADDEEDDGGGDL